MSELALDGGTEPILTLYLLLDVATLYLYLLGRMDTAGANPSPSLNPNPSRCVWGVSRFLVGLTLALALTPTLSLAGACGACVAPSRSNPNPKPDPNPKPSRCVWGGCRS